LENREVVNKRELARYLKTSVVTIGNWIERYEAFPILQPGTNGRDYKFDLRAVVDFLRAQKDAETRFAAERDEALAQLVLPLVLEAIDPPPSNGLKLSTKDQIEALKLSSMRRQEAERLGQLVPVAEVSEALIAALATFSRMQRAAVRQAAADQNLPHSVVRALEQRFADAQRTFVREAGAYLTPIEGEGALVDG
jgi:phage terminase Nu1 subunit (DNA packaging protein)